MVVEAATEAAELLDRSGKGLNIEIGTTAAVATSINRWFESVDGGMKNEIENVRYTKVKDECSKEKKAAPSLMWRKGIELGSQPRWKKDKSIVMAMVIQVIMKQNKGTIKTMKKKGE